MILKEVQVNNPDLVKVTDSSPTLRVLQRGITSEDCCEPVVKDNVELGKEFVYWVEMQVVRI